MATNGPAQPDYTALNLIHLKTAVCHIKVPTGQILRGEVTSRMGLMTCALSIDHVIETKHQAGTQRTTI